MYNMHILALALADAMSVPVPPPVPPPCHHTHCHHKHYSCKLPHTQSSPFFTLLVVAFLLLLLIHSDVPTLFSLLVGRRFTFYNPEHFEHLHSDSFGPKEL